jgi:plastocyanin
MIGPWTRLGSVLLLMACVGALGAREPRTGAGASAPGGDAKEVSIDNFTFSPQTLTVSPGTQVTWINHDDVPHTVVSSKKPRLFASATLDTDQKFSHVFKEPGTYAYFCTVHPHMTGKIIVK